mgnify:CR=1 FL=1
MIPFRTTLNQRSRICYIVAEMLASGLDGEFVKNIQHLASEDQGVFDLMSFWSKSTDEQERSNLIIDMKACLKDYKLSLLHTCVLADVEFLVDLNGRSNRFVYTTARIVGDNTQDSWSLVVCLPANVKAGDKRLIRVKSIVPDAPLKHGTEFVAWRGVNLLKGRVVIL